MLGLPWAGDRVQAAVARQPPFLLVMMRVRVAGCSLECAAWGPDDFADRNCLAPWEPGRLEGFAGKKRGRALCGAGAFPETRTPVVMWRWPA